MEGDLTRADQGDTFPVEAIAAEAEVLGTGNLRLRICLDADVEDVEPGRYVGTIQLTGSQVEATPVSLEATLRRSRLSAIVAVVVGLAFGLLLKAGADLAKTGDGTISRSSLASYVRRAEFVYAFLVGLLASVLGYLQLYEGSDTWGESSDIARLLVAGIAAQVTGMTAFDLVKPFRAPPS